MAYGNYPVPAGVHAIPHDQLDLRSDAEIDHELLHPKPVDGEKNLWFFWHSGYSSMPAYTKRNIRAWHRRFSKQGWAIRVLDHKPGSPLGTANFLDLEDPNTFPEAFRKGSIGGDYIPQTMSDLVRFPLLLKYGGVYADAGMVPIGDIDHLWNTTIGDPDSPFEIFSFNLSNNEKQNLTNYFMASGRNNPLFERSHRLLLALWAEDGGKTSTIGMHKSPLLKGVPLLGEGDETLKITEDGKTLGPEVVSRMLADYLIQSQAITLVMGLLDEEDGWNGPKYVAEHVYAIDFTSGSQLINHMTQWNGFKQFELMSLQLPVDEPETEAQKQAREIVEACLSKSFGFKLATGFILRISGETLSSLWRKHEGSDDKPGTYAHWFRHGTVYNCPDEVTPRVEYKQITPIKRGPLLREI